MVGRVVRVSDVRGAPGVVRPDFPSTMSHAMATIEHMIDDVGGVGVSVFAASGRCRAPRGVVGATAVGGPVGRVDRDGVPAACVSAPIGRVHHHPRRPVPHPVLRRPVGRIDHITPAAEDGPTSPESGPGLCERRNHAKPALGCTGRRPGPRRPRAGGGAESPRRVRSRHLTDPGHRVGITTPTGHHHPGPSPDPESSGELPRPAPPAYPHPWELSPCGGRLGV